MVPFAILISSFLLGLTASFAPCLFPVLPSYLAYLTGNEMDWKKGIISSVLVTLGVLTIFMLFGLIISQISFALRDFLASNYVSFRFYEGLILLIFGILIGIRKSLKVGLLESLTDRSNKVLERVNNPWAMSYLIGLFFAFLAAPCAVIVFTTFFTFIIEYPMFTDVIVLNIAFAAGAGIPFVLLGAVVPSFKESVSLNQEAIYKYLPIATGLIISGIGIYLMVDAINLGYSFST